ncbi:N-acetylmuramoyl-L-alanine amidase [Bernardetia sp. Wsw4-3y2]|uniref:N-acetylmuramoyl-L-alanine amidase family protein n=1 Tax=Bernardetia sp. Wsw4-3y2 TaxID=3127471 RepID=UPI0030CB1805
MIWRIIKPLLVFLKIWKEKKEEIIDDEIIINIPITVDTDKYEDKEPIEVLTEEIEKEQCEKVDIKDNLNKKNLVIFRIGHGLDTIGKETPKLDDGTIVKEYQLNKWIVEKAIPMVEDLGYESVIANPYDYEGIDEIKALNVVIGHINRITLEAQAKGKKVICIDVHCNAHQPNPKKIEFTNASGTVSFFWKRIVTDKNGEQKIQYSKEGEKLAIAIHKEMVEVTGLPDRAWSFDRSKAVGWNYMVLRKTLCPSVTVECAFMTNRKDLGFLMSSGGKRLCAKAITTGINNYFIAQNK